MNPSPRQEPITASYPPLPLPAAGTSGVRLKICIASYDFVGPVRNGGVGTAFTSLGEALARAGHDVTFFYLSGKFCENLTLKHWIDDYQKKGIRFVPMPELAGLKIGGSFHMAKSYEAFTFLRQQQFDIIHFSEWRAPGYYSMVAKKQGLAFQNTTLCIHTHGPTLWSLLSNGEYLTQIGDVELDFMERHSVKLADVVVSPSHYLTRWMHEQNWQFPEKTFVQQYVQPANARRKVFTERQAARPVRELVFFGRIEVRKGLVLFCDAMNRLIDDPSLNNLKITFLGKLTRVNDKEGMQYLQERTQKWPWKWEVISNLDQGGALNYLQGEGRLALIPSMVDNLPNTVLECLGGGVPFLASEIGGIPEMICPEDREGILFPLQPPAFAAKILHAVRHGVAPSRFAIAPDSTERGWLDWHNTLGTAPDNFLLNDSLLDAPPLVSVCMSHFNRPEMLEQALDSLRAQDYKNFEVVLVDDASTKPEAIAHINSLEPEFARRGWQLIRNQEELFVGAARNLAARHARGEFVMFMDDDNIAKPNEVSAFVHVARKTNADIVSCCLDFFSTAEPPRPNQLPDQRFLFLGPAESASALRNYLGDTNSLFRREVFLKLGGFHEERSVGHEDWELISDAILKGYHHEVIPDALVWYRRLNDGASATTQNSLQRGHLRNIRPYLDAVPPALRTLILFTQGQVMEMQKGHGASPEAANQIAYLKLSQRWRGYYESARELFSSQQRQAAAKLLKSALTAASETNSPVILLEALMAVGTEMHATNDPDTRKVLQMAAQLATNLNRKADLEHAKSLINTPTGKARPVATAAKQSPAKNISVGTPKVSIIIPVFNNLALTQRCLLSLSNHRSTVPYEIIVVNNASTDGSTDFLQAEANASRIRLINNPKNEGFARGCNLGAQAATGELLLFLNNDTQVTAGWLEALVNAAKKSDAGVAGAKLLYANGTIQHAGIEFIKGLPDHPHRHAAADLPAANQPRELDMVTGACFLTPADLFRQLAGFDEVFRNGVEDVDYCLRVRAASRKVIYEPASVVYHHEGQSAGRFNHVNENLKIFFTRWGKAFDAKTRFVVPAPAQIIPASQSIFSAPAPMEKSVAVSWEGSFLDHGSLSHVNRELAGALKKTSTAQVECVTNGSTASPDAATVWPDWISQVAAKSATPPTITVRHAWPPNWNRPAHGKLAVIQPWEFGTLPEAWVKQAQAVDEFWLPSEYVRRVYAASGVPAEKLFVVPNGVDTEKFHPQAAPRLLTTNKKFKFLFVGGTIARKGPDVLLQAYLKNFTAADDVCLVIKDFGGKSVYNGQTIESQIRAAQAMPGAAEILYLNAELASDELPGLYRACDCLVLPYRGEGFGLPVLEAMACGLPVIVTDGGATDDFVTDDFAWRIPAARREIGREVGGMKLVSDGWVLEPQPAALGEKLRHAFQNPAECRERGALARQHAQNNWTWKNSATIIAQRIQHLATSQPTPAKPIPAPTPMKIPDVAKLGQLAEAQELFQQKNFPAASNAAWAAIARRPFHPEAFMLLAEITLAAGNGAVAKQCAQRARELAPSWLAPKQFISKLIKGDARLEWFDVSRLAAAAPRVSVCLIAKNEEKFLAQCLNSVRDLAAQIIVVDTGSTDRTVEIAKEFGAEIYSAAWCDDFSAARNAAIEHATGDWILILDADEELPIEQHEKLLADIKNPAILGFRLPLVNAGQEREGRSFIPRLFRNAPGVFFHGRIHEQVFPSLLPLCKKFGAETALGAAEIRHHGYSKEMVRDRNKVERNLNLLKQAIAENPSDANLLMNLGLELVRSEKLNDGIEQYRLAFETMSAQPADGIVPELREALLTQFTSQLYKVRGHEEVVRVLTSRFAKDGMTASLHFALGLSLFELKNHSDAAKQMRECLSKKNKPALTPVNTDVFSAAPWHCLALCLTRTDDLAGAEKAFQSAIAEPVRNEEARLDFAKFLRQANRPVEALQQLNEIVGRNPANANAWRLGGEIALGHAEYISFARDWTGEALAALLGDSVITAQRAEALLLNGDLQSAAALWGKICQADRSPRNLAALILCETIGAQPATVPDAAQEPATSQAFIEWYQKLIAMRANGVITGVNERLEKLSPSLPSAARMIENALNAAGEPVGA